MRRVSTLLGAGRIVAHGILILCTALLGCLLAGSLEAQNPEPVFRAGAFSFSLRRVVTSSGPAVEALIEIATAYEFSYFDIQDPMRLVVDIKGDLMTKSATVIPKEADLPFSKIRIGPHPGKTRLVFDLTTVEMPKYQLVKNGRQLHIFFSAARQKTAVEVPPPTPTLIADLAEPTLAATFSPTRAPQVEQSGPEAPELAAAHGQAQEAEAKETPQPVAPKAVVVPPEVLREKAKLRFSVDRVFVDFTPNGRPVQNIMLHNTSEHSLYMTTSVDEVKAPGLPSQSQSPAKDLVVSPKRFELKSGAERTVRLLLTKLPMDVEKVFRVALVPQADPFSEEIELKVGEKLRKLNVVTGIAVHVTASPQQPSVNLEWERERDRVMIKNTGNVSISLINGKVCGKGAPSACLDLPSKYLYPGTSFEIIASPEKTLQFLRRVGDAYEPLIIAPGAAGD